MFVMTELRPYEAAFLVEAVNWEAEDTEDVRLIGGGHATYRYYQTKKGRQIRIEFDGEEDIAYCLIEIMQSTSKLKALYDHQLARIK